MLRRALGNLVSNAIRHTPGGESVRVELSTSEHGEISIVVENPGAEIPPEHLPRLFDRFYRVDPARQEGAVPDWDWPSLNPLSMLTGARSM